MSFDSVLLIGFGGPGKREEIRPFLDNVLRGRPVPPARYEQVVKQYELIGGRSPYNDLTFRQAKALEEELKRSGAPLPVYVGMRNWDPYYKDTLARMVADGRKQAAGFILAPHRSEASWDRYQEEIEAARKEAGSGSPDLTYLDPWHDHPQFLQAAANRVQEVLVQDALEEDSNTDSERTALIFTAHSLPESMASRCSYVEEIHASSRGVATLLDMGNWSVAFQSRSGNPRDPWLGPDINDVIREKAQEGFKRAVLMPIGFLCDHVEVLFDLDIQARATAEEAGIRFLRAPTVGDHPAFIKMLAQLIRNKKPAGQEQEVSKA